jgi:ABC-type antimicrobial peptide transport system permease subunit
MSNLVWIVSGLLLLIGAILIGVGIISQIILKKRDYYKGSVTGTVIDIVVDEADQEGQEKGIREYFYPVLGYYANGKLKKVQSKIGSYPSTYKINDKIKIKFNEKEPEDFILAENNPSKLVSRLCYLVGIACCVLADFIFIIYTSQS